MQFKFLVSMIGIGIVGGTREASGQAVATMISKAPKDALFYLTSQNSDAPKLPPYFDSLRSFLSVQVFAESHNTLFQKPHARAFRLAAKAGAEYLLVAQ